MPRRELPPKVWATGTRCAGDPPPTCQVDECHGAMQPVGSIRGDSGLIEWWQCRYRRCVFAGRWLLVARDEPSLF